MVFAAAVASTRGAPAAVIVDAGLLGKASALEARARDLGRDGELEQPPRLQLAHDALRQITLLPVVLVRVGVGVGLRVRVGLGLRVRVGLGVRVRVVRVRVRVRT